MMYVIWSIREAAWVTSSFTYSSQFAQARRFTREEAYKHCIKHAQNKAMIWMPVNADDITELMRFIK